MTASWKAERGEQGSLGLHRHSEMGGTPFQRLPS